MLHLQNEFASNSATALSEPFEALNLGYLPFEGTLLGSYLVATRLIRPTSLWSCGLLVFTLANTCKTFTGVTNGVRTHDDGITIRSVTTTL